MREEWLRIWGPSTEANRTLDHLILWHTNDLCTFKCEYCIGRGMGMEPLADFPEKESPEAGKYDPRHIAKCFDDTGKTWRIWMQGGETFLYPRFVELAQLLTQKHYILIDTNLTTSNVYDFANVVPPDRVKVIRATSHVMERIKKRNGVEEYIKKFLYLQDRGFNIWLEYVAYPPLLSLALQHIDYFRSRGIRKCNIKPFFGFYKNRNYPEAYTEAEKAIINQSPWDPREVDLRINPFGRRCSAGQIYFIMDISGNLRRCPLSGRTYGNLFTGEYSFDEHPRYCLSSACWCPQVHEGLISTEKGSTLSVLKERMLELDLRPLVIAGKIRSIISNSHLKVASKGFPRTTTARKKESALDDLDFYAELSQLSRNTDTSS